MLANFADLYERYAPEVYRFALSLSGDPALSDDLVSETFVRAWTAPSEARLATIKAYLFTITRNLFLSERSKRSRDAELEDSLPAPGVASDMLAELRSELRAVLRGLQELPEADRAAVALRASSNLTYEEIASVLNVSVAAAKVKVHRARRRLMKLREVSKGGTDPWK
jgi:RNA polymerase sigma-70 factor (ECF subfamily)